MYVLVPIRSSEGGVMPKVAPFYSVKADAPKVYHDNSKCTEGKNIEPQSKQAGTDNRRKCDHCTTLDKAGD